MDFGYVADATTMIATLVDMDNRKIYIFDELYEHGLLNNEIATEIIAKGYGRERIIEDAAENQSIDEIKGYGVPRIEPAIKGNGSIMQGIQFINQFKIYVHPKCKHTIDELENYSYKKDRQTGLYLNEPVDNFNHVLDALRYAMEPFNKKQSKVIRTIYKSALGL